MSAKSDKTREAQSNADLLRIADSLPRQPWGIGSRYSDALAFAHAVLAANAQEVKRLREALIELCEAEEAAYPDASQGSAAQKAWCERRHNARLHARLLVRALQGDK